MNPRWLPGQLRHASPGNCQSLDWIRVPSQNCSLITSKEEQKRNITKGIWTNHRSPHVPKTLQPWGGGVCCHQRQPRLHGAHLLGAGAHGDPLWRGANWPSGHHEEHDLKLLHTRVRGTKAFCKAQRTLVGGEKKKAETPREHLGAVNCLHFFFLQSKEKLTKKNLVNAPSQVNFLQILQKPPLQDFQL